VRIIGVIVRGFLSSLASVAPLDLPWMPLYLGIFLCSIRWLVLED
jgi:ABC-type protease/lipase transport system fused ATPase/permease subunit